MRTAADFANAPVAGNAYSDRDPMMQMYEATIEQVLANNPDAAFEILDLIGIKFMGVPAMEWAEFEACLRDWQLD